MKPSGLLLLAFMFVASVARAAPPASTPETEREARRLFDRAEAHYKAGAFAEALAEYQAGYDRSPLPGFLINIAQCQRRLGDLRQARVTYRKFIMVAPDSQFVPNVKKLIAELDELILDGTKADAPAEPAAPKSAPPPVRPAQSFALMEADLPLVAIPPPPPVQQQPDTRLYWLWGGAGAVAIGALAVAILVLRDPGTATLQDGSLGTLRR